MERYFKVSESELLELIARDWQFAQLEAAGVDNWDDGGVVYESFSGACKEAGLPEDPEDGYLNYSYKDLAKTQLKYYQEVK